ncbi:hypothetical protein NMY22_g4767 [Coprinellus aureogranulatus]|nr:hypothetical protein NMY22_g4767 [Coprinellus aureogranulatus]
MGAYYDEIEIEDMTWDAEKKVFHYPCPCGDRFEISKKQLKNYEDIATCPSCSLIIRVIYDPLDYEDEPSDDEDEEGEEVEEESEEEEESDDDEKFEDALEKLTLQEKPALVAVAAIAAALPLRMSRFESPMDHLCQLESRCNGELLESLILSKPDITPDVASGSSVPGRVGCRGESGGDDLWLLISLAFAFIGTDSRMRGDVICRYSTSNLGSPAYHTVGAAHRRPSIHSELLKRPLRLAPQTPIIDPEDDSMGSPTSSFEDLGRDAEAMRREEQGPLRPPSPPSPQLPNPQLEAELQQALDKAEQDRKKREEHDYAVARQLDHELNAAKPPRVPGDFPDDAAGSHHRKSSRGSGGGLFSSHNDKYYEEKYLYYKRKFKEMERAAIEWQQRAHENREAANRHYQELRYTQMDLGSAQKHVHHLDTELKSTKHELNAVKQQLSDAVNLSEVRGKELKGAQVFLTKADTLSVSDVVQKVTALNEEIFQMAAFLGEVLVYEVLEEGSDRESVRQHVVTKHYKQAETLLGGTLASALSHESMHEPKEESNPLLVQIVMQIALTQWCANLGSRWTSYQKSEAEKRDSDGGQGKQGEQNEPGGNATVQKQYQYDGMLRDLYDSIRDHEEQAVAGRWRSLTRAHLPFSANGWDHTLMINILSIMGVAGWAVRHDDETEQIEKRLASIFKPLLELRKAIGEDVTSADLDIAVIEPRTIFDPRTMEDEYADGRSASSKSTNSAPEAVVSTSGLGLKKLTVKKLKEGGVQRYMEMLALPKVVLEKTIKEALEPPPPAKKKKKPAGEGGGLLSINPDLELEDICPPSQAILSAARNGSLEALQVIYLSWPTHYTIDSLDVLLSQLSLDGIPERDRHWMYHSMYMGTQMVSYEELMLSNRPKAATTTILSLIRLPTCVDRYPALRDKTIVKLAKAIPQLTTWIAWSLRCDPALKRADAPYQLELEIGGKRHQETMYLTYLTVIDHLLELDPRLKARLLRLDTTMEILLVLWMHTNEGAPFWGGGSKPRMGRGDNRLLQYMHSALSKNAPAFFNALTREKICTIDAFIAQTLKMVRLVIDRNKTWEQYRQATDETYEIPTVGLLVEIADVLVGEPRVREAFFKRGGVTLYAKMTMLVRLRIEMDGTTTKLPHTTHWMSHVLIWSVSSSGYLLSNISAMVKEGILAVIQDSFRFPFRADTSQYGTVPEIQKAYQRGQVNPCTAGPAENAALMLSTLLLYVDWPRYQPNFQYQTSQKSPSTFIKQNDDRSVLYLALLAELDKRSKFFKKKHWAKICDNLDMSPFHRPMPEPFRLSSPYHLSAASFYQPPMFPSETGLRDTGKNVVLPMVSMLVSNFASRNGLGFATCIAEVLICVSIAERMHGEASYSHHTRAYQISIILNSLGDIFKDAALRDSELKEGRSIGQTALVAKTPEPGQAIENFGRIWVLDGSKRTSPAPHSLNEWLQENGESIPQYLRLRFDAVVKIWEQSLSACISTKEGVDSRLGLQLLDVVYEYGQLLLHLVILVRRVEQVQHGHSSFTYEAVASLTFTVLLHPSDLTTESLEDAKTDTLHSITTQPVLGGAVHSAVKHFGMAFAVAALAGCWVWVCNYDEAKTGRVPLFGGVLARSKDGLPRSQLLTTLGFELETPIYSDMRVLEDGLMSSKRARLSYKRGSRSPQLLYGINVSPTMRFIERATALGAAALSVISPLLPHFKDTITSRGLRYHYYFSAPEAGKPTLLLIHGFPSLAVDWHPQITYFREKGYGIVAADQLGYGGTDKPANSAVYVHSLQAKDMVDILDHENVTDVVAVGHDWGSKTVSVLANLYSDRFLGFGFLACGYRPPHGMGSTLEELRDASSQQSIELLGYETFGYWEFFTAPDAPEVIQNHLDSWFDLLYARDGRLWRFNMAPTGAFRIFLESGSRSPRITAITDSQWAFHEDQFGRYTLDGPLNYYRISLNGETKKDDDTIPLESYTVTKPVFFGGAHGDVICVDWAEEAAVRKYSPNLTVANFNTTHWVAADAPHALNEALEKWINEVVLA